MAKLKTAQIGKSGELLVQLRLLLAGIESSPMTTDSGVDLVAYSPRKRKPLTIQVKTNLRPKPGGGKGRDALDWWIREETPVDYVALVDLSSERIWLLSMKELERLAQQKSSGRYHIYMYTKPGVKRRGDKRVRVEAVDFSKYELQQRIGKIFGAD